MNYERNKTKTAKCAECEAVKDKDLMVYDSAGGEWVCEEHLNDKTGYCSIGCQRGFGCDGTC